MGFSRPKIVIYKSIFLTSTFGPQIPPSKTAQIDFFQKDLVYENSRRVETSESWMRAVGFCKKHLVSWHHCKKQHLIKTNPRRVFDKKYVLCLVRALQCCADYLNIEWLAAS